LPAREALTLYFARASASFHQPRQVNQLRRLLWRALGVAALIAVAYATVRMSAMLATLSRPEAREITWGATATFLRVEGTLVLAALWTVPVGILVGLRPKLSAALQP